MSRRARRVVGVAGVAVLLAGMNTRAGVDQAPAGRVSTPAVAAGERDRSLFDRHCVSCHNDRLKTGGLSLAGIDLADAGRHAPVLEKVVQKLRSGQMPPQGRPRPDKDEVAAFLASLERSLDALPGNPGRVPAHRLTRFEYVNAVKDLLGLDIGPELLPPDTAGVGFDNNADLLTITPGLLNRYMMAASKISRLAIGDSATRPAVQEYRASEFAYQTGRMNDDLPFGTHGGLAVRHIFPADGEYTIKLRMQRNTIGDTIRGLDDEHEIQVRIDHALVHRFRIGGQYKGYDPGFVNSAPEDDIEGQKLHTYRLTADDALEVRIPVEAGQRLIGVAFTDIAPAADENVPLRPSSPKRWTFLEDAGFPGIERVVISGPQTTGGASDTPSRRQIFICRPQTTHDAEPCARRILSRLAKRAYRRPVEEADVDELMRLFRRGNSEGGFDAGVGLAVETLLWSPAFLVRIEDTPAGAPAGSTQRISEVELASRLSFFLWRSIPDDELIDAAAAGRLRTETEIARQVRRMLADPRSRRWVSDFAGQWLTVRNLKTHEPDPDIFPDFDDNLREAMLRETELFFETQVREDRSVLDLLSADYTFVNERLARHYGIPNIYGSHFRRVAVADPSRRGLLGHASVLTATSYADRTSVVLRGKWVLETFLGAPPPPPPADVPPLQDNKPGAPPASLRQRMEQHRDNPTCSACHAPMDPLGFALENFDATGRWRERDGGAAIDAVSTALDGATIQGAAGFRDYLSGRGDEFVHTLVHKMLEYSIGRSLEYYDAPVVRRVIRAAALHDYRWSSLIAGLVQSPPFRMRKVADSGAAAQ
jgi:mono/diheme cytochrome c family protein